MGFTIRDAGPGDVPAVLELNRAWEHVTSPMGAQDLAMLSDGAALFRVVEGHGRLAAFTLALAPGADYESVNYLWFDSQAAPFLYIDRVVVSADAQRGGLGAALYRDAFAYASEMGLGRVVCEVDVEPLNAPSVAFHDRMGFLEVGTQWLPGGKKRVSLRERTILPQGA